MQQKVSIGILAVQAGYISQQQLMDCLDEQRAGGEEPVSSILIRKGYLSREQLSELHKRASELVSARAAKRRESGPQPVTRKRTRALPSQEKTRVHQKTRVRKTTEVRKKTEPGRRASGTRVTSKKRATEPPRKPDWDQQVHKQKKNTLVLASILAGVPILVLLAFIAFRGKGTPKPEPDPGKTNGRLLADRTNERPGEDTKEVRSADLTEFQKAHLRSLEGNDEIAQDWNQLIARVNQARSAEQYVRIIPEVEGLLARAKGSAHERTILKGLRSLNQSVFSRAEYVFVFLGEQVQRFIEAGRYGDAVDAWDMYPLILDMEGLYARKIEDNRGQIVRNARTQYDNIKGQANQATADKRHTDAKNLMVKALEIGIKEIVDDAYDHLAKIVEDEDKALREAELAKIAEFEKQVREQRDAGRLVAALRARFWELSSNRQFQAAEEFLSSEAAGGRKTVAGYAEAIAALRRTLADFHKGYAVIEKALVSKVGRTLTLIFAGAGGPRVSTVNLKRVGNGKIVADIQGKEFTRSIWSLDPSQIVKTASTASSRGDRAIALALGRMLQEDFDAAHKALADAGRQGETLRSFIETSSAFMEQNVDTFWARARALEKEKKYKKAIQAYSKLVAIKSQRAKALKARARASYQAGEFVSAVLDVDTLFQEGVVDRAAIDILNQSYQRATLIDKAIRIYENARKKFPEDGRILGNLVALYMKIHEYDKASEALASAKRLRNLDSTLLQAAGLLTKVKKPAFTGKAHWMRVGRYRVETNVSQDRAGEVARFMDKVYKAYAKVFPYVKNETLVFHVKLFKTEGGFQRYYQYITGTSATKGMGKVMAYYMPLTKELVGWEAPDIQETLQHEGLHQFMDYYVSDCPIWFNEGYASYFEKSTATEARFNPSRHNLAKYALMAKKLPSLEKLFLMSRGEWNSGETVLYYGLSWSVIYYLTKQGRKDLLDTYFEDLMAGKTQRQAFDALFGPGKINLKELEAKWRLAVFNNKYD